MKRFFSLTLCCLLLAGLLAGCGSAAAQPRSGSADTKHVVATIFPVYDWLRQIVGDTQDVEVTLLVENGVDLHSYQPTAQDMVKLSACDLFVYVGGESDAWVHDAIAEAVNKSMVTVSLLDALGDRARAEELAEGMQGEAEEGALDEHVWLSLRNAKALCALLAERLGEMDPANRAAYAANAETYGAALDALDREYQAAVDAAPLNTLLFGDRFPFLYLTRDYGLDYYAAFAGCSAETEASFETVIFLAEKLDALALPAVLILEDNDGKLARTVIESSQSKTAQVLTLDSLQSTTARDAASGATYLGAMRENLDVLRQALKLPKTA